MAKKTFEFAFVQGRNLEQKWYPVQQATVEFELTGADDPLTLQRLRDAVAGPFAATQKKINEMIPSRAGQIAKLSLNARARKEDVRLIDSGNQQIQRWLEDFKKEADGLLDHFAQQEKKKAERIEASATAGASTLKWVISVAWTAYQGVNAVKDIYEGESPAKIYDGIKGFVDALTDLQQLAVYAQDQFADEKTVRAKVKAGFKKLQGQKSFTESDVATVTALVESYETKTLAIEKAARQMSAAITKAIAKLPADGITPAARKEAERTLDEQLQAIVSLSTTLKRVDKQLTGFKLYLGRAKSAAKKDKPQGWLSWIGSMGYDLKDVAFDLYEGNYAQAAKGLSEKLIDKLIKTWSVPENVVAIG